MTLQSAPVQLVGFRPPVPIQREDVYFSFSSGRFSYDCVECGAKCCRGHGYALHAEDVRYQLEERKALTFFLDKPKGPSGGYAVQNLAPSCFFLSDGGQCEIHASHGYQAKPETCRLFPFNDIRKAGKYLLVGPHPGLCPLMVSTGVLSSCSDHENLYLAMEASGIRTRIPEVTSITGDLDEAIQRELRIRAFSDSRSDIKGYRPFVIHQLRVCAADSLSDEDLETTIDRYEQRLFEILGGRPSQKALDNESVVKTMVAITPVLRSQLLFVPVGGVASRPLLTCSTIPYFLIALNVMAAFAIDSGMRSVTYQTLMSLSAKSRALLVMLACVDQRVWWRASAEPIWPLNHEREFEAGYLAIVRALLRGRPGVNLGDLLNSHAPLAGTKRVVFLRQVAKSIVERISTEPQESVRSPWSSRKILRRLTLQYVSPKLLQTIAERQRASQKEDAPVESESALTH